jgi:hypothetical protein
MLVLLRIEKSSLSPHLPVSVEIVSVEIVSVDSERRGSEQLPAPDSFDWLELNSVEG